LRLPRDVSGDDLAKALSDLGYRVTRQAGDGRTISVPLVGYPRLLAATPEQRANWRLAGGGFGIHWPGVDEDLTTEGLLRGAPAPRGPAAAGQTTG